MYLNDRINGYIWFILLLAVVLAYANTPFNGFVWDDSQIIVNNLVNRDLKNIYQIFTSADVVFSDNITPYFRPLNRFTYMLDYRLFELNPFWYHLENIFIHLANVLLLFYLLSREVFKRAIPAAIAALLFAVHPANAEAVNFISGRNNVLAVFFVLLSLIFYLRERKKLTVLNAAMMGLFFFAGLLCKETALMLVAIVVFFEIGAVGIADDRWQRRVTTYGILLGGALLYFKMRSHALGGANFGSQLEGLWERLANNIYIIPKYLSVLFYPAKLNAAYSIPRDYTANSWWLVFAWLAIGAGVIYLLLKKNQPVNFGLYWFAVTFIPISNIVQIPSSPMAERYIYMPAIGLWIVIAGVLEKLLAGEKAQKTLLPVFALACVLLMVVTFNRNKVWADDLSLFNSMVVSQPEAAYGHYNLGNAYRETGDFTRAEKEWETTVALNQKHSQAWNQLGNIHLMYKYLNKAEYDFSMALRANATNSEAHYNLATILEELGRPGEAVVHYEHFLRRVPPEHAAVIPEVVEKIRQLKPPSVYAE